MDGSSFLAIPLPPFANHYNHWNPQAWNCSLDLIIGHAYIVAQRAREQLDFMILMFLSP